MAEAKKLRVGMIGADHCASKFHIPAATDPEEILNNPEIDVVFVLTSDEFHDQYTVAALQHGKHVFVEKPLTFWTQLFMEAFDGQITPIKQAYCRFLGTLGSHDLSLMREALGGLPESVAGVSVNEPFYSAIFNYRNRDGSPYAVTYETGRDKVGRFDAHLAVYGEDKTVSIHYDTPYVKGLPIKVKVDELNESGEAVTREILSSFQDTYTCEFEELYKCLVEGKPIKTSAEDALNDLWLFDMMYKKYDRDQKNP